MSCETHIAFLGVIFKRGESDFRKGVRTVVKRHDEALFLKLGQMHFHQLRLAHLTAVVNKQPQLL